MEAREDARSSSGQTLPVHVRGRTLRRVSALHVRSTSSAARCAVAVVAALVGCGGEARVQRDAGPPTDAFVVVDTDRDGLCDATEVARGTDPDVADSDGDGFADLVELQLGGDPLAIDTPSRDSVVVLRTNRLARLSVPVSFSVSGTGGTYVGGFIGRPRVLSDDTSAADHFLSASAVAATPTANADHLEGETFFGVTGRTLLAYQVDFEYRGDALVECMTAYPFSYQAKLDGSGIVGSTSRSLVLAPEGMEPGTGTWCEPVSCF